MKAWYVDRISRAVVTMIVHADTAREALEKAQEGHSDATSVDVEYFPKGYSKPRRAPEEDLP